MENHNIFRTFLDHYFKHICMSIVDSKIEKEEVEKGKMLYK